MILNQPDFFARSATLDGAISDTDTQITLSGLSSRFTDAVAAGTVRYPIGPFRVSDDDGFELIAITGHVSGSTFEVEREIQGTTAEAWADGTAVRSVVTAKNVVKNSALTTAQAAPFYGTNLFYATFDVPDQDANNFVTASGHTLTVVQGTASIENQRLVIPADTIVAVEGSGKVLDGLFSMQNSRDGLSGVAIVYTSVDEYIYCATANSAAQIGELVGGVRSSIVSSSVSGDGGNRIMEKELRMEAGFAKNNGRPYIKIRGASTSTFDTTFYANRDSQSFAFIVDSDAISPMRINTAYCVLS